MHAQVAVQGPTVTLGDVAVLHTTELPLIQRLAALPLGAAPRTGGEAVLHRDSLQRWIRTRTGLAPERILWVGEEQTVVRSTGQVLSALRVQDAATAVLHEWLQSRTTRFHTVARPQPDVTLPGGAVSLTPRPLAAQAQPTTHMVVWVDVAVDGAFVRAVPVSFELEAYRDGWVATQAIDRGSDLSPHMLRRRELPVGAQPVALLPLTASDRRAATRLLRADEPLTETNTRKAAQVRRGDIVNLRFQSGPVALEARAEALQEGDSGEIIRVRTSGAAQSIAAKVLDRGQVEALP